MNAGEPQMVHVINGLLFSAGSANSRTSACKARHAFAHSEHQFVASNTLSHQLKSHNANGPSHIPFTEHRQGS